MGRSRKIRSVKALAEKWEEFKIYCDNYTTTKSKDTTFIDADGEQHTESEQTISTPITYTIVGFCVFLNLSKSTWYATYENDPRYADIVAKIHAECEADVRTKFETGVINTRLAPLWMSKYGYGAKLETTNEHKADNNLLDAIKSSLDVLGGDDDGKA